MANTETPHPCNGGPLDTARTAFDWLVTGPHPVTIDGALFTGLPDRRVALHEVRDRLLARRCRQATRDAVWAHLVLRSRTEGATWTVGCVGVALPALTRIAARLTARFAGDGSDIHAAVLAGFLAELAHIDLRKPRVMLRLRWAAYRAGHTALREALDAPVPSGDGFASAAPPAPWGHPDFVLARAVADGVLTAADAELIGATRLEGLALAEAAAHRGSGYQAIKRTRHRAEQRLAAYLHEPAATAAGPAGDARDVATQVANAMTLTTASCTPTPTPAPPSPSVSTAAGPDEKKSGHRCPPRPRNPEFRDAGEHYPPPATPDHTRHP